jgi:hypothetical protein
MTSREPKKIPNKKAKRWERDRESGFDASKRWDKKWYKAQDESVQSQSIEIP